MSTHQSKTITYDQVEKMLASIQPEPTARYTQRMAKMPWKTLSRSRIKRNYGFTVAILSLLLIVAFFLVTPVGNALAQEIIQFFSRAEGDIKFIPAEYISEPVPTLTTEPPFGLALIPAVMENPRPTATPVTPSGFSLDEAEELAGFDLFEPSKLPRDYNLTQVDYDTEKQVVSMWYRSPQASTGEFYLVTQGKNLDPYEIGASAKVESIPIGDINAELVKGGWFGQDGSSQEKWEDQAEVYMIRWEAEDISIQILIMLNETFSPAYITRDEMTSMAQGFVQCPNSNSDVCNGSHAIVRHLPMPPVDVDEYEMTTYMSLAEIEPWTEFDVLKPSLLPEGIPFSHVLFNPKLQQVWISCGSFAEDLMHSQGSTLFIYENLITGGTEFDESLYPVEAIEKVTVNEIPATLVKGRLESTSDSTLSTWKDSADLMLSWVNNGVQYGISFAPGYLGGEQLSTENIILIAESLH